MNTSLVRARVVVPKHNAIFRSVQNPKITTRFDSAMLLTIVDIQNAALSDLESSRGICETIL